MINEERKYTFDELIDEDYEFVELLSKYKVGIGIGLQVALTKKEWYRIVEQAGKEGKSLEKFLPPQKYDPNIMY